MAPVPVIFSDQAEGGPGPSLLGTGDYNYDSRSMLMTTAAICATREISWSPSFYRGEQYDSDLALYYLRARYYNTMTGRFVSMDPENGIITDPATLHKYLYAGGEPVNHFDPMGREALMEYGLILNLVSTKSNAQLTAIAKRVNCILKTTAETLLATVSAPTGFTLATIAPDLATCVTTATYVAPDPDPYPKRYFGTHWCGPGGAGPPINGLDQACQAHDKCYDDNGLSIGSNYNPFLPPDKKQALERCNKALCNAAAQSSDPGSIRVFEYFSIVPVGSCRLTMVFM